MKVLVTGSAGQLGAVVCDRFREGHEVIALTRQDCDFSRPREIDALARYEPDAIVNCVAWTDVDGAETHPVDALDANAIGVSRLATVAARTGSALIHIST
ncbi:MAG: sugar nucleotide-binding protein, partial [Acidobacteriota bacterium]|nr:sugar nucleotide-binding protein [Acidobacteriota bacterium]